MKKRKKIAILGSGQLSQMLEQAAHSNQIQTEIILEKDISKEEIQKIYPKVDAMTFESEFIDLKVFDGLKSTDKIRPSLACMKLLQNKLSQKELFKNLKLPQPDYIPFINTEVTFLQLWINSCLQEFPRGCVFKWASQGYDGRGVFLNPSSEMSAELLTFCDSAQKRGISLYCETFIPFQSELAIIATRNIDGAMVYFPLVHTVQKKGVCYTVEGPASKIGYDPALEIKAQAIAEQIGASQEIVGTFAIELFVSKEGELFINELAPRVHNSGHFSIEACSVSQFENHVHAVLGDEVHTPKTKDYFLMVNLLGPDDLRGLLPTRFHPKPPGKLKGGLHWYDKRESRPGRKLGHITVTAQTHEELLELKAKLLHWVETEYPLEIKNHLSPGVDS